jgi:hypothetical protein
MLFTILAVGCMPKTSDSALEETDTAEETATDTEDSGGGDELLWTKYKVETPATLRGVYSSGAGVYVFGSRGQAWTGSSSEAWTPFAMPVEFASADINATWGIGAQKTLQMAVACDDGYVGIYANGAWTVWSLGTQDNRGIGGTSLTDLYVVGENGIQHFNGTEWSLEIQPTVAMNAVWSDGVKTFAVGDEGVVMIRDSGGSWASSPTKRTANLYGVDAVTSSDVWVVGDQGAILRWNGSGWVNRQGGTTETLNSVFMGGESAGIAVANGGVTIRYDGSEWTKLTTDTDQNLYAVHGASGTNAWAVGNGGLAMQYVAQ